MRGTGTIDAEQKSELRELVGARVAFDEPLARYTSLRVGGPADALVRVDSRDELARLCALCRSWDLPLWILGGGFNTLVRDEGVRGVVVRLQGLRRLERERSGCLYAEAGVTHSTVARFCADHALTGLEFAVGIPGTVGGWLAMNAGIADREMKDVTLSVELLDPASGHLETRERDELRFGYRHLELSPDAVLLAARFATRPGDAGEIRAVMRRHLDARRDTQPTDQLSCGSVFKNPPGDHSGRLIEAAGLKGVREGGAEISLLHANFIVNRGGASAADVLRLIARAREAVESRFGVSLETEVHVRGEDA
ncbi:MAG: UDP-N-acetylmuramate dehydrogenase [Myxococcota bacterium]